MTTALARMDNRQVTPRDVDTAIRSQASLLGVRLDVQTKLRYPAGGGIEEIVIGCDVGGSLGQCEAAAEIIRSAMQPADAETIEEWIAELSVLAPKRQDDEFTESLRLEAYVSRLGAFPRDVVHSVLLGRSWKFFPSWFEVEAECKKLSAPRQAMLSALMCPAKMEPEHERERVSPEAAKAILEQAGFTPKRFNAVSQRRMATTQEQLDAADKPEAQKHWTETADPDGWEMQSLRKAREGNKLMGGK